MNYEARSALNQYFEAHYGEQYFGVRLFPETCARMCLAAMGDRPKERALDLGCSVGRATFELAREMGSVTGVDYSKAFIEAARTLREEGYYPYEVMEEGDIVSPRVARLAAFGLMETRRKVQFYQGDAIALEPELCGFDLVFAGNLLDRLHTPGKFLAEVHERVKPGGLLVITSPYTWLEEITPKENWVGGFVREEQPYTTFEGMSNILTKYFRLLKDPQDIEFVIRETRRKYQHSLAQLTIWERRR